MPLQCNIDSKGKAVRLIYGIVLLIGGIILIFTWARGSNSVWPWVLSGALAVSGAFAIFEARAGWCVVRAIGFKTPV
jgi:uncharacterized membrane protein HdeD (DUF308 family)